MSAREKLIIVLKEFSEINECDGEILGEYVRWEHLANFIIADRKRIVEPLINITTQKTTPNKNEIYNAVHETLKLAGVNNE